MWQVASKMFLDELSLLEITLCVIPSYRAWTSLVTCFKLTEYGESNEMSFSWLGYRFVSFTLLVDPPLWALIKQIPCWRDPRGKKLRAFSSLQSARNWGCQSHRHWEIKILSTITWSMKQVFPQMSLQMRTQPWLTPWLQACKRP